MSDRTVKQTLGPIKVRRKIREKDVDLYDFKHLRQHLEFPGLADNKIKSSNEKLVPLSSVYPIKPNDSWVPWPVFVSLIFRFATGPKAEELKNFLCAEPPRSTPTSSSSALVKQKSKATLATKKTTKPDEKDSGDPSPRGTKPTSPTPVRNKDISASTPARSPPVSSSPPSTTPKFERELSEERSWEKPVVDKFKVAEQGRPKYTSRLNLTVQSASGNGTSGSPPNSGNSSAKKTPKSRSEDFDVNSKKSHITTKLKKPQLNRTPSMRTEQDNTSNRADQKKALTKTQAAEKAKAKKITQQNKRTQLRKEATMKLIDITAREQKLQTIFSKLDKTKTGLINAEALSDALSKWGTDLSYAEVSLLMQCFSSASDKKVLNFQNFSEFLGFYTELRKGFDDKAIEDYVTRKALGEILAGFKYKFSSAIVNKLPELFTKSGTDEIHFQEYFTLLVQLKNLDKQFQEHNAAKKQVFLAAPQFHTLLRSFGIYISVLEIQLFLESWSDKSKLCFIQFEDLVDLIINLREKRSEIEKLAAQARAKERQQVLQDPLLTQNFRISRTKRVAIGTMSFGQKRHKIRATMVVKVDEALVQIESQFKEVVAQCKKSKKKFVDTSFPASMESLCKPDSSKAEIYKKNVTTWLRPSEVSENAKLFLDSIDEGDLSEGVLPDPWYISAIAVLAANGNEGTVKDLFVLSDESIGVHVCRFWLNGKWSYIMVDDLLPSNKEKLPAFGRCRNNNEYWISILEKCYAKFYGSYEAIYTDGQVTDALVDFTGEASEILTVKNTDTFWRMLVSHFKKSFLLAAVSERNGNSGSLTSEEIGIYPNLAYTILECQEYEGVKLVRLRNAWGKPDWKGRWSNGSEEWTSTFQDHFQVEFLPGIFFMKFEDFTEYFTSVSVLRLPSMDEFGLLWKKYELTGQWKQSENSTGGSFNNATWTKNPQYKISVTSDTELFISLRQSDKRSGLKDGMTMSQLYASIGFFILKKDSSDDYRIIANSSNNSDIELMTMYDHVRELSAQFFAEKNTTYVLVPSTYFPSTETEFNLTVFSNFPIEIKPLVDMEDVYESKSGSWTLNTSGGSTDHFSWRKNPQYLLTLSEPGTFSVVLEQQNTLFYIGTQIWKVEDQKSLFPKRRVVQTNAMHVPTYLNSSSAGEYVIMCATYNPMDFAEFTLKITGREKIGEVSLTQLDDMWKMSSVSGEWTEGNCGGCSDFETHYLNPKFHLKVPPSCVGPLIVVVQQHQHVHQHNQQQIGNSSSQKSSPEFELPHVGFYFYIGDSANEQSLIGVSEYVNFHEVSQNFQMEEDTHGVYTIMPTTYHPGPANGKKTQKFTILAFSIKEKCELMELRN